MIGKGGQDPAHTKEATISHNFNLIWSHTKSLIDKLLSSRENLFSEELYSQYTSAFDQLMTIANNPAEQVTEEMLRDVLVEVRKLEQVFADEQVSIEKSIAAQRRSTVVNSTYLSTTKVVPPFSGFNKES
jgi:hypothetical protein